ncbi:hypothetical protein KBD71_01545 [Candidatus Woesebacteria bacterium]|nr:hypothetical protein [Candidatus Woesebacteria bacterium]
MQCNCLSLQNSRSLFWTPTCVFFLIATVLRLGIATSILGFGVTLLTTPAQAQTPSSTVTLSPPFVQLSLLEGSTDATQLLELSNTTNKNLAFQASVFLFSQVDSQGTTVLTDKPPNQESLSIVDSINVAPSEFELAAGQKQILTVSVANQLNLAPGGHYAAVVIRSDSDTIQDTPSVVPALSSFLLIRKIGGEQFHLSLGKVPLLESMLHVQFPREINLVFENQGNTHVIPRGTIAITDVWGRNVMEGTINEGSLVILPRAQRELRVSMRTIRPSLPSIAYNVTIQGRSEPGDVKFTQTGTVFILDIPSILLLLCPVLAVLAVLSWKKSRRKQ